MYKSKNTIQKSLGERVFTVINIMVMLLLIFITIYPVWYVVCASFSDAKLLMGHMGALWAPKGFSLAAYKATLSNKMILSGYANTLFVLIVGLTINMMLTLFGAYVLARRDLYWKKYIMMAIVFTMVFSGGLIPFYLTVKQLHLDGTLWSIILPTAVSTFNLIIMRTAIEGVPYSIIESAEIDGAGHYRILFSIVSPVIVPTLAVIALYYAVGHWNSWFNAMIFLTKRDSWPLQLVLRDILIQNDTGNMSSGTGSGEAFAVGETIKYAVIVVATVPVMLIYPFLQKYFVKGATLGAVKG